MKSANSKTSFVFYNDRKVFKKLFDKNRIYNFFQEYFIVKYLNSIGLKSVPNILDLDKLNNILFFEFIDPVETCSKNRFALFEESTKNNIDYIKKSQAPLRLFAKEALEDTIQSYGKICNRVVSHQKNNIANSKYVKHIKNISIAVSNLEKYFLELVPSSNMVFSQADVGIHNSIVSKNNSIYLVDMEYAGLDSPIKLHIDYLIHPRNVEFTYLSKHWTDYFYGNLISEKDLKNINIYNAFFALQWSLIVLNEFLPHNWNLRALSDPSRLTKRDKILENQIKKSEIYLKASNQLYDKVRPQSLFTESERILLSKSY